MSPFAPSPYHFGKSQALDSGGVNAFQCAYPEIELGLFPTLKLGKPLRLCTKMSLF